MLPTVGCYFAAPPSPLPHKPAPPPFIPALRTLGQVALQQHHEQRREDHARVRRQLQRGDEDAAAARPRELRHVGHGRPKLAAHRQALDEAQHGEQDRRGDTGLVRARAVRRQAADGDRRAGHHEDGQQQAAVAAGGVADVAKDDAADGAGVVCC
jgi:hypothetical protein